MSCLIFEQVEFFVCVALKICIKINVIFHQSSLMQDYCLPCSFNYIWYLLFSLSFLLSFPIFGGKSQGTTDGDQAPVFTTHGVSKPMFAAMNLFCTYMQNLTLIPVKNPLCSMYLLFSSSKNVLWVCSPKCLLYISHSFQSASHTFS